MLCHVMCTNLIDEVSATKNFATNKISLSEKVCLYGSSRKFNDNIMCSVKCLTSKKLVLYFVQSNGMNLYVTK